METQRDVDNDGVVSDDIDMEIAYPRLSIHQILKIYPNHSSCIQQYVSTHLCPYPTLHPQPKPPTCACVSTDT